MLFRINRNIVECKCPCRCASFLLSYFVLIETLWNVNTNVELLQQKQKAVLIETLWNVNFDFETGVIDQGAVLIETLWNVNINTICDINERSQVLIETLWNVNIVSLTMSLVLPFSINRNIVECKF